MKKQKIISTIILTFIQLLGIIILYQSLWLARIHFHGPLRFDISWGITLRVLLILFSLTCIVSNILYTYILSKEKGKFIKAYAIPYFIFTTVSVILFYVYPYRLLLFMACSFFAFFIPAIVSRKIKTKTKTFA